jgi:hypothetical protein
LANRLAGTTSFSRGMNLSTSQILQLQAFIAKSIGRVLPVANLPSRADVLDMRRQLHGIEERLAEITETLSRLNGAQPHSAAPAPARTRKPPAKAVESATPKKTPRRAPRVARKKAKP